LAASLPDEGYSRNWWCLTPLSTIFQLYLAMNIHGLDEKRAELVVCGQNLAM
jgi:hypothetical protein